MRIVPILLCLLASACSSPPKPTLPDESDRRPVNDAREIERLRCASDLTNTRIALGEATRLAERANAAAAEARLDAAKADQRVPSKPAASQIYSVLFPFNVTTFELSAKDAASLLTAARSAEYIAIRGRTDGELDLPGESRVARARAESMQVFLIRNGVDPTRIALSWQPSGDHLAANTDERGRALNRRVEVELYVVRPVRAATPTT